MQLDESSPLWSELCPSAKGAVLLYQKVKPEQRHNNQLIASGDGWFNADKHTKRNISIKLSDLFIFDFK